jgi:acyl-CoA thioesterase I
VARKHVSRDAISKVSRMFARALPSRLVSRVGGAMRFNLTIAVAAVHLALIYPVWAEVPCPVPDELALHNISLPNAKKEVATGQRLVVLTFGGVHDLDANAEAQGATYPARLQAELSEALPHVEVKVANEMPPGKDSSDVPPVLPGLISKTGARLLIWGPGGRDVATKLDLGAFLTAVKAGIDAAREAGADLILLDTTFVPSPSRMAMIDAYREKLRSAATAAKVPLLRRDDLMRHWSEEGTLNLAARDPAERDLVARHLFACVAHSLAGPIAAAVR